MHDGSGDVASLEKRKAEWRVGAIDYASFEGAHPDPRVPVRTLTLTLKNDGPTEERCAQGLPQRASGPVPNPT